MYDELVKRLKELQVITEHCDEQSCDECENRELCDKHDNRTLSGTYADAADAIEELIAKLNHADDQIGRLVEAAEERRWIPVTERLPEAGVHVLLACKCGAGAYVCDGFHTEKYSTPTQFYEDIDADYNEDADEYYFPEGWWEVIKNWDDYSCVAIEDKVTHWMPLPEPPKEE